MKRVMIAVMIIGERAVVIVSICVMFRVVIPMEEWTMAMAMRIMVVKKAIKVLLVESGIRRVTSKSHG